MQLAVDSRQTNINRTMNHFDFAKATRKNIAAIVSSLTLKQLNKIPAGLNNNIAWHLGHIVVSTELLCYVRTGVDEQRVIPLADKYRNGTKPDSFISQEEVDNLLSRLVTSIEKIEEDYSKGLFTTINPYATHTFGIEMDTIEMVFAACSHHDVLHAGNIGVMRKLV